MLSWEAVIVFLKGFYSLGIRGIELGMVSVFMPLEELSIKSSNASVVTDSVRGHHT